MIVIVDIEKFGTRSDPIARDLRTSMYQAVHEALAEAGVVRDDSHMEDRGDGMIILLPATGPVELLGGFVRELESAVRHRAGSRTAEYQMRLRVAIHSGFVWNDGRGWISSAINTAARLVDAEAVRAALSDHPDAQLVVVVADSLYHDVVAQGYPSIDAGAYRQIHIHVKEVDTAAWVYLPRPGTTGGTGSATPESGATEAGPAAGPGSAAEAGSRADTYIGNQNSGTTVIRGNQIGQVFHR